MLTNQRRNMMRLDSVKARELGAKPVGDPGLIVIHPSALRGYDSRSAFIDDYMGRQVDYDCAPKINAYCLGKSTKINDEGSEVVAYQLFSVDSPAPDKTTDTESLIPNMKISLR